MNVENFIAAVKKYPILYDPNHKDYRNVQKRYRVWDIVAGEMNESSEVLRVKWKGLKDGFRKYKKNGLTNWLWAEELQFLEEYTVERGSKSKTITDDVLDYQNITVSPTPMMLHSQAEQYDNQQILTKRTATESSDQFHDAIFDCTPSKRPKTDDDAVDYLFKSYAATFKTLPIRKQIELKMKLATLFHDAEMEQLKADTWMQAVIKQSPRSADSD